MNNQLMLNKITRTSRVHVPMPNNTKYWLKMVGNASVHVLTVMFFWPCFDCSPSGPADDRDEAARARGDCRECYGSLLIRTLFRSTWNLLGVVHMYVIT